MTSLRWPSLPQRGLTGHTACWPRPLDGSARVYHGHGDADLLAARRNRHWCRLSGARLRAAKHDRRALIGRRHTDDLAKRDAEGPSELGSLGVRVVNGIRAGGSEECPVVGEVERDVLNGGCVPAA